MNIKPLYDRVVITRMEEEKMSAGGIVIPDSATEKPIKGEVVAVGEGKALDNGSLRAPKVKVGDKVLFGKYAGTEVKLDGADYLVVKEDDIFAVLEPLERRASDRIWCAARTPGSFRSATLALARGDC